jgi:DMSO/TMAO reductase YedYZ heme-binding membrane subunit
VTSDAIVAHRDARLSRNGTDMTIARNQPKPSYPAALLEGWPLLGVLASGLVLGVLAALATSSGGSEGIRLVIRITARTSLVLFCLAFTASALFQACPTIWTRWQRRNRRYLGLAFALSHGLHGLAIIALASTAPTLFKQLSSTGTLISGGLAYLFILAMAATSFDRTAAMIGPKAWRWLHLCGAYYIWLSFMVTFGKRAVMDPFYWPLITVLIAALALRLCLRRKPLNAATATAGS